MTRTAARSIAPAVVAALALLAGGCSADGSTDTSTSASASTSASPGTTLKASASAALCSAFANVKTDAGDLVSTKVDTSGTPEQVQQQVDELAGKADKVRDDLATMMRESNGGAAAAVIGVLNQKADALKEDLTLAKGSAQEEIGPKITAAQEELKTALVPVDAAVSAACPSS